MSENLDTNLYSRQIGTFGMETMGKLIKMNVLIVGMRGLGCEIAKNIILAGPHEVKIFDNTITTINDLCGNFYLTENDVGKNRRDEGCLKKLAELNPYVHVALMEGTDIVAKIKEFNVVVITEIMNLELLFKINEICRENKIGFIYTACFGISGFVFDDFGKEHFIHDKNGEECKTYLARIITNDPKQCCVTIDDTIGGGKLSLADGDFVTFKEVKGMTELNDGKPRKIKFLNAMSFAIEEDTSKYGEYQGGGIIEQVKLPEPKKYKSLQELFYVPYTDKVPDPIDFSKFGRNELLHCAVRALHEYYNTNKSLPELNNKSQCDNVVSLAKNIYNSAKEKKEKWIENSQEFNENLVYNVARWAKSEISPICAFLGGVVAQEIVKFTGKYTPFDQWMWFDFFETVANLEEEKTDRTLNGTRYDDQIAIYGNEIQKKINDSNIFMIGAGALGCEFLKNMALMGIATNEGKSVTVTDNDNIETSNLNRQFLFRKENIGHSKSKCACESVRSMNNKFHCKDLQSLVAPENEHIFNENFWNSQTFIINAVDNIKARRYIDTQCTTYNRPLIDSGTLGTKAHVQMIIPHVTSCYNDTQDPPEDAVPMCTIHNFPAMIEHCIEWSRDHFNEYFTDVIVDAKKLIENPDQFYEDLKKEGNTTLQLVKLRNIKKHIVLEDENKFEKVIEFSVMQYTQNFDHNIRQLLFNFPEDYKNNDGSLFWTGSKRCPHPIPYDANDPVCFNFVKNYSIILARALSINYKDFNDEFIKKISSSIKIPDFVAKNVKIKVKDDEADTNPNPNDDPAKIQAEEENELNSLMKELSIYDKNKTEPAKFKPEDFEKDDDTNGHIDFIFACSNLRARNYKIKEADRQKVKMIAGKIIPAIATTTAAATGIVSLQLYTLFQTNKIEFMRNCFMNLAIGLFVMTEPAEVIKMKDKEYDEMLLGPVKAIPPGWTVWDKIEVSKSMTCKEFIDYVKERYNVDTSVITSNNVTIIQTFMPSNKNRYDEKIEDLYNKFSKKKLTEDKNYLWLEISGDIDDATALMPLVKYKFK
jgi:ubiquitin-activating enzyme E1